MLVLWGSEMRTLALLVVMAAAAVPMFGQDRVTVEQLEQRLAAEHTRSDRDLAHRLENLQLTQRLSAVRLQKLEAALPGPESRAALFAVADLSEVLDLPPAELSPDPPPGAEEQRQILARLKAQQSPANPLPDFDATANVTRFRNLKFVSTANTAPITVVEPVPMLLSRGTDAVTYREGRVFITQISQAWAPADSLKAGVENWDSLYALLSNVLHDMLDVQPEWARWEQGIAGKMAVFRFSVDEHHAHFPIRTVIDPSSKRGYNGNPGYRAEITLDPATGAVDRLVLCAAFDPGQHVSRADAVAEFSPVTIEGKSFLAPRRTVTIGVTQSLLGLFNVSYRNSQASQDIRPLMHLTDTEYADYRPGRSRPPAAADPAFLTAAIRVMGEHVSVEQLEELAADLRGHDDRDAARRLGQLELTQRLTADRYARLRDLFPGSASSEALLALYDLSAFADLPKADLAAGNPPDSQQQGQILSSAVQFVAGVTHKMPDLFATRQMIRFEDLQVVRGAQQPFAATVKPLIVVDQSSGTVHFREGREILEAASKNTRARSPLMGLETWGTFGPILEIVMTDILHSKLGWSHWERGPAGPLAVLRYAVPQDASHYDVRFCCYLADDGLPSSFSARPGYHGELAIDPNTGAVLRLVLKTDLRPDAAQPGTSEKSPLLRNDVLVDYGTIDIAGKQYICPTRFVSVMTSWTLGSQGPIKRPLSKAEGSRAAKKALALMEFSRVNAINEATFRDYHVFRSEMRIVSDNSGAALPPKE